MGEGDTGTVQSCLAGVVLSHRVFLFFLVDDLSLIYAKCSCCVRTERVLAVSAPPIMSMSHKGPAGFHLDPAPFSAESDGRSEWTLCVAS